MNTSAVLRAAADDLEAVERERDELAYLNDLLSKRVAELEDGVVTSELRKAYRRGYITGHHAGAAGRPRETAPERHARGDFGRRLRV